MYNVYHTRDGTVLPPTMTSRRRLLQQQSTVSVVNMSLMMDVDCDALARHQHCYDDVTSTRRRARRRRRRHDDQHNDDVIELMDTAADHVTGDDVAGAWPVSDEGGAMRRRTRVIGGETASSWPAKWTSSRYLLTHRRRRAVKSRHQHVINDVTPRSHDDRDVARRSASSPVRHDCDSFSDCVLIHVEL